ncbi:hypothetical protein [Nonomuraea insulae]|uniref:Uncharacterized protein n=1 Tax=Nonomuraea insulae TaxID=1616787 RepID=A0ABW1D344_9ACTN
MKVIEPAAVLLQDLSEQDRQALASASMTQQHSIAVAKNGRHNPDRTGAVSGDRHRHILTHADLNSVNLAYVKEEIIIL